MIKVKRKTRTIIVNNNKYVWWCKFYDKKSAIIISPIQDKTAMITIEFSSNISCLEHDDIHAIGNYPEYLTIKKDGIECRIKTIEPKMVSMMLNQLTDTVFQSRQNAIIDGIKTVIDIGYSITKIEMGVYW